MYGERDSKGFSLIPPITQAEEGAGGVVNRGACVTGQGMDFTSSL